PISPCEQFKRDILDLTGLVAREVVSQLAKLLQLVVDDAAKMDVNEVERNLLEKMVKLIEVSKQMDNLGVHEIFEEVEMIFKLEELDSAESGGLIYELMANVEAGGHIYELLHTHGIDALDQHLNEIFGTFFVQLENHIELYFLKYEHSLTSGPLDIWLTKFLNQKSLETKAMVIEDIWDHLDC
ncbi:hypothetical protein KR044_005756, partial [Drosophila immigrans]